MIGGRVASPAFRQRGLPPDMWDEVLRQLREGSDNIYRIIPQDVTLTPAGQAYADQVVALAENNEYLSVFHTQLHQLEAETNATLSGTDLAVVQATIDIARYSADYWEEDLAGWEEVCGPNPAACEGWDDWSVPEPTDIIPMGKWTRRGWRTLAADVTSGLLGALRSAGNPYWIAGAALIGSTCAFLSSF
jgi:hypothetical protein